MGDSADFEVLSYEEVEEMKKESSLLVSRIEAIKRKYALESKLRDAAQSLNRLYSTKEGRPVPEVGPDGLQRSPPSKSRRSLLGRRSGESATILKTDDEYATSVKKCEDLAQELWRLEQRQQLLRRKILEHTAGVLQMTHKGLKKNIRREELPRSPESMASHGHQSVPRFDGVDDFDDRSMYRIPDYIDESGPKHNAWSGALVDIKSVEEAERRLEQMTDKLRQMMQQLDPRLSVEGPRLSQMNGIPTPGSKLPARLDHLEKSLDAIGLAQARTFGSSQRTIVDSEGQLDEINTRLYDMLTLTNNGHTPTVPPPDLENRNLRSQLSFVGLALGQLGQRLEHYVEQKSILTTQIQQQRELNSKSDAERDAQITELTEQLAQSKKTLTMTEQEAGSIREHVEMLMEQLDEARQQINLREQQRFMDESKALQAEREVHQRTVDRLQSELEAKQEQFVEAQANLANARNEYQIQGQQHEQKMREIVEAKERAELEAKRCQGELSVLEGEVARAQTELTVVRAELDGAYGTRAQRAADVSANPLVQREIDNLNEKNSKLTRDLEDLRIEHSKVQSEREYLKAQPVQDNTSELQMKVDMLQRELKDTVEDYELMTKASIEFERERDQLEEIIDGLRERCDNLEGQLSDERVRLLGMKSNGPTETTSVMVLKNEFKKMMRDTRAENIKTMKVRLTNSMIIILLTSKSRLNKKNVAALKLSYEPCEKNRNHSSLRNLNSRTNSHINTPIAKMAEMQ